MRLLYFLKVLFLVHGVWSAADRQYCPISSPFFFFLWHRNIWLPCRPKERWWIPGMSSMKWPVSPEWEQLLNMHGWKINEAGLRGNVDVCGGLAYNLLFCFLWYFTFEAVKQWCGLGVCRAVCELRRMKAALAASVWSHLTQSRPECLLSHPERSFTSGLCDETVSSFILYF